MEIDMWKVWLEKFYPVQAEEVKGGPLDFIKHSLNKWKGLRELEDYDMEVDRRLTCIRDRKSGDLILWIDANDCSLCLQYRVRAEERCRNCPIVVATGEPCNQTFKLWDNPVNQDPEPMIALLEKTLQFYESKEKPDEHA